MKIKQITAAALCMQVGLAIPHGGNHEQLHKRVDVTTIISTAIQTLTVTDYSAVVWVDQAGNIVKTEHKTSTTEEPGTITLSKDTPMLPPLTTNAPIYTPTSNDPKPFQPPSSSTPVPVASSSSTGPKTENSEDPKQNAPAANAGSIVPAVIKFPDTAKIVNTIPGFGVAYDAWTGSGCRASLDSDFDFLASQGAHMIRVYDVCFTESVNAAANHNLKLMIGLTSFDDFDNHLNRLASSVTSTSAGWSVVDTVFIGNELVNKKAASAADVAAKVSYARGILKTKGYNGNVVTVDTWTKMRSDAVICSTSDYCAINTHAFFDGNVLPADAGKFVRMAQNLTSIMNPGKRIVISESGWPHAGAAEGKAIPGIDNQRIAMSSIVHEFAGNASDMFLFMAYDAEYKTNEKEIERNFGIFDSDHYNGIP